MEVKEINFYDETLLGVQDENGQVWLAVKKTCLDIGLTEGQAQRQITNIQKDLIFSSTNAVKNLNCKFATQVRKFTCIKEEFVTLWLAKLPLTPTMQRENPETVDKLIRYQLEAQKVLHDYFMGTEEKKQNFYNDMGITGRIAKLEDIITVQTVQINNMESLLEEQMEVFNNTKIQLDKVMSNMTLTTTQQNQIHRKAKDRVNHLLGGAHSQNYKDNSRTYFINLWNGLKAHFECGSHWQDLNPACYDDAIKYVEKWTYKE